MATVHYHSHLFSQVQAHGALCFSSCFVRESYLAHALEWCKGKTHVLSQLVTWYEISQNVYEPCSLSISDIFDREKFCASYMDKSLIDNVHQDFALCLQGFSAHTSDCLLFSRYWRGLVCYHSMCYSRRGYSISHFVSIQCASCIREKQCFASVPFYFSLHCQSYAFIRFHPCLTRNLLSLLGEPSLPVMTKIIDSYFNYFDERTFSYRIVPVSSVRKKVIKIPSPDDDICLFTPVQFDFEHD